MTNRRRTVLWISGIVLTALAATGYVLVLRARLDERVQFLRAAPVSAEARLLEVGTRGSLMCFSPSCEEAVASVVFGYPDMATLCDDVRRLQTNWTGVSDVSTHPDGCSWSGKWRLARIAVTGHNATVGPRLYILG